MPDGAPSPPFGARETFLAIVSGLIAITPCQKQAGPKWENYKYFALVCIGKTSLLILVVFVRMSTCITQNSCQLMEVEATGVEYFYLEGNLAKSDTNSNLQGASFLLPINGIFQGKSLGRNAMTLEAHDSQYLLVDISGSSSGCQIFLNVVSYFRYEQTDGLEGIPVDIYIQSVSGSYPNIIYEESSAIETGGVGIFLVALEQCHRGLNH